MGGLDSLDARLHRLGVAPVDLGRRITSTGANTSGSRINGEGAAGAVRAHVVGSGESVVGARIASRGVVSVIAIEVFASYVVNNIRFQSVLTGAVGGLEVLDDTGGSSAGFFGAHIAEHLMSAQRDNDDQDQSKDGLHG